MLAVIFVVIVVVNTDLLDTTRAVCCFGWNRSCNASCRVVPCNVLNGGWSVGLCRDVLWMDGWIGTHPTTTRGKKVTSVRSTCRRDLDNVTKHRPHDKRPGSEQDGS